MSRHNPPIVMSDGSKLIPSGNYGVDGVRASCACPTCGHVARGEPGKGGSSAMAALVAHVEAALEAERLS